jgi:hypothetical protein
MIEIHLTPQHEAIHIVSIPNQELIKSIISMPDSEYSEILTGIVHKDSLSSDRMMIVFAYIWNQLKKQELNPAQIAVLKEFIKTIKIE